MEKRDIISSGLLEMYATGAASPEEIIQVERWRTEYPEINSELINIEKAMESYAMANAIIPSGIVKDKIFASLQSQRPSFTSVGQSDISAVKPLSDNHSSEKSENHSSAKVVSFSFGRIAAAASILLLLVSNIFYYNKYRNADTKYREGEEQLASMNTHLREMNTDMGIVQSKYSKPIALDGMEAAPDAAAKIFWMKNTGEVYVDPVNMPMAPSGKQYQLWAFVDGKPVDAGMISSKDGKRYTIQKMKTFGKAQAFAITLEAAGGHPQPEGKIYVMGKI